MIRNYDPTYNRGAPSCIYLHSSKSMFFGTSMVTDTHTHHSQGERARIHAFPWHAGLSPWQNKAKPGRRSIDRLRAIHRFVVETMAHLVRLYQLKRVSFHTCNYVILLYNYQGAGREGDWLRLFDWLRLTSDLWQRRIKHWLCKCMSVWITKRMWKKLKPSHQQKQGKVRVKEVEEQHQVCTWKTLTSWANNACKSGSARCWTAPRVQKCK